MDLSIDVDVLAARTGDRDAFSRLVTRYRGLVTSISLAALGNVATSEDVAQDVFLCAWRDFASLRNPSSFLPWLRQLTRHRALDAARGGRRRERRNGMVSEAAIEAAVDLQPNGQDALLEDERTRAVVLGLEALPDDAREVLTLYYREERSIQQVARLLGLREDTVKKRLSRARSALREEVLARLAEALDSSAPNERFTTRVMRSLPPVESATALAVSKGVLSLLGKSAALALAWSWLIGIGSAATGILWSLRRDLRGAIDARERRQLKLFAALTLTSGIAFMAGMFSLPPRGPTTEHARLVLGTTYVLLYASAILSIYYFGYRPAKARRRSAEVLVDPSAALRHAREDRIGRLSALGGVAISAAILAFAWIRLG